MSATAGHDLPVAQGGPVFVVGTMGSGSTLLRLMLDSHEHLAIAQETGFMRAATANLWPPFFREGGDWYRRIGLDEDEFVARLRDFYGGLFADFAARSGKRRWGEKTPSHVWQIRDIARLFPDAVVIATVRHPCGVVGSLTARFGYDVERAIRHWNRNNLELLGAAADVGERLVLCRYEDLVARPADVMHDLLAWLGEPWSDAVLRHHDVHRERGTPRFVEGHNVAHHPIDPLLAIGWTTSLEAATRSLAQARTAPLARYFGYQPDDPWPCPLPAGEHGASLACGVELTRRRADHPDVAWDSRRRAPLGTRLLTPNVEERTRNRAAARSAQAAAVPPAVAVRRALAQRLPLSLRLRVRRAARPARTAVRRLLAAARRTNRR